MPKPIQFMHIAKTAGSYVNLVFSTALGDEAVVEHAESRIADDRQLRAAYDDGVRFFSGHVYRAVWDGLWKSMEVAPLRMTVLRDPIGHVASHIRWLDHYNDADYRSGYQGLSPEIRRLVDLIGATDITSPGALDHLLTHLPPIGIQMLDNCQSRYFLCGGDSTLQRHDPLTLAHVPALSRGLDAFDLVMRQDTLSEGIAAAARMTGLDLRPIDCPVNIARSERHIDHGNPVVRAVLSKRTLVDQWLWRHVTARPAPDRV